MDQLTTSSTRSCASRADAEQGHQPGFGANGRLGKWPQRARARQTSQALIERATMAGNVAFAGHTHARWRSTYVLFHSHSSHPNTEAGFDSSARCAALDSHRRRLLGMRCCGEPLITVQALLVASVYADFSTPSPTAVCIAWLTHHNLRQAVAAVALGRSMYGIIRISPGPMTCLSKYPLARPCPRTFPRLTCEYKVPRRK